MVPANPSRSSPSIRKRPHPRSRGSAARSLRIRSGSTRCDGWTMAGSSRRISCLAATRPAWPRCRRAKGTASSGNGTRPADGRRCREVKRRAPTASRSPPMAARCMWRRGAASRSSDCRAATRNRSAKRSRSDSASTTSAGRRTDRCSPPARQAQDSQRETVIVKIDPKTLKVERSAAAARRRRIHRRHGRGRGRARRSGSGSFMGDRLAIFPGPLAFRSGSRPVAVHSVTGLCNFGTARLCLDCEEVHDAQQCPVCASETFTFMTRWVPAPERRERAPACRSRRDQRNFRRTARCSILRHKPNGTRMAAGSPGRHGSGAGGRRRLVMEIRLR